MENDMLKKYAALIVKTGANVKKGQGCFLYIEANQNKFANLVVEEAYKAGAAWVQMMWTNQKTDKLKYQYENLETLSCVPKWQEAQLQYLVDELPCRIFIESEDPDGLNGVDIAKMQASNMARAKITKPYRDAIDNLHQWTIAAIPSKEWAKKVFPQENEEQAIEKLWEEIFKTVRISENNDPLEAWEKHDRDLIEKSQKLNSYHFDYLHYTCKNGTDFTCKLIPNSSWLGGGDSLMDGTFFNPNMPTEEIFI
ncbi:MAG: aminopeptidase, partial [Oscillospiraceae bacterium]